MTGTTKVITGADLANPKEGKEAELAMRGERQRQTVDTSAAEAINAIAETGAMVTGMAAKGNVSNQAAATTSLIAKARDPKNTFDVESLTSSERKVFDRLGTKMQGALTARDQGRINDRTARIIAEQALKSSVTAVPGLESQLRAYASEKLGFKVSDTFTASIFNMDKPTDSSSNAAKNKVIGEIASLSRHQDPEYFQTLESMSMAELYSHKTLLTDAKVALDRLKTKVDTGETLTDIEIKESLDAGTKPHRNTIEQQIKDYVELTQHMSPQEIVQFNTTDEGKTITGAMLDTMTRYRTEVVALGNTVTDERAKGRIDRQLSAIDNQLEVVKGLATGKYSIEKLQSNLGQTSVAATYDLIMNSPGTILAVGMDAMDVKPEFLSIMKIDTMKLATRTAMGKNAVAGERSVVENDFMRPNNIISEYTDPQYSDAQQGYAMKKMTQHFAHIGTKQFNEGNPEVVAPATSAYLMALKESTNPWKTAGVISADHLETMEDVTGVDVSKHWGARVANLMNQRVESLIDREAEYRVRELGTREDGSKRYVVERKRVTSIQEGASTVEMEGWVQAKDLSDIYPSLLKIRETGYDVGPIGRAQENIGARADTYINILDGSVNADVEQDIVPKNKESQEPTEQEPVTEEAYQNILNGFSNSGARDRFERLGGREELNKRLIEAMNKGETE